MKNPRPCIVCDDPDIVGAGTWVPDERTALAACVPKGRVMVYVFCLCETHMDPSEENGKAIKQAALREIRFNRSEKI
jgi:hypothetical protein